MKEIFRVTGKYKILRFIIATSMFLLMLCVWPFNVVPFSSSKVCVDTNLIRENGVLYGGNSIMQEFTPTHNNLYGFELFCNAFQETKDAILYIQIFDEHGDRIYENRTNLNSLNSLQFNYFRTKIKVNEKMSYQIKIELEANNTEAVILGTLLDENGQDIVAVNFDYSVSADKYETLLTWSICVYAIVLILWGNKIYKKRKLFQGIIYMTIVTIIGLFWFFGKFNPMIGALEIRSFLVAIMLFMGLGSIVLMILSYSSKKVEVEKLFVVTAVIWGFVYTLVLAPFAIPDEITHFISANKMANQMMGIEPTDENGNVYIREEDNRAYSQEINYSYLSNFYYEKAGSEGNKTLYVPYIENRGTSAFFLNYLPQSVGIMIARFLQMDYLYLVFAGRLLNLCVYIILIYFAIKLIPFGKWFLYAICQFPMMLQQSASYSYDAIIIGMAFLFSALCLHYIYKKEEISHMNLVLLFIVGVLLAPMKVTYFPLLTLLFFVPFGKTKIRKKYIFHFLQVACILVGTILILNNYKGAIQNMASADKALTTVTEGVLSNVTTPTGGEEIVVAPTYYSLEMILKDKMKGVYIVGNTLVSLFSFYVTTLVGKKLGIFNIDIPDTIIIAFVVIAVLALLNTEDNRKKITNIQRGVAGVIFLIVFGLVLAAMLFGNTPNHFERIGGVQGRYFLPIIPLILLMVGNVSYKIAKPIPPYFWVLSCNLLNIGVIMQTFWQIINK